MGKKEKRAHNEDSKLKRKNNESRNAYSTGKIIDRRTLSALAVYYFALCVCCCAEIILGFFFIS